MIFTLDGSQINEQEIGLLSGTQTVLDTGTSTLGIAFRSRTLIGQGPQDSTLLLGRLYDSEGNILGIGNDFPQLNNADLLHQQTNQFGPVELCRVRTGENNGANPPTVFFGGISWFINVGTVNGVPNTIPDAWKNLRLELKFAGKFNRFFEFVAATSLGFPVTGTIVYKRNIEGTGQVSMSVPITVTI
jgi:hypothetical protein